MIGCSRGESDLRHDEYTHVPADVSDEKEVRTLFSSIRRDVGYVEYLLNNAGVASMNHSLDTPLDAFEKMLSSNVLSTFLFSREASKIMRRRKRGRIVNFTTVAVPLRLAGEAAYVASKAAVEALSRVMAKEVAHFGVTVNAVGPSPVETDLIRGVPNEKIESLLALQALARHVTMEEVVRITDFFISPSSGGVTGQVVYMGGLDGDRLPSGEVLPA